MRLQGVAAALLVLACIQNIVIAQVLVGEVAVGQAGHRAGLQVGDLVSRWENSQNFRDLRWPLDALLAEEADSRLLGGGQLKVERSGQTQTLTLPAGPWGLTWRISTSANPPPDGSFANLAQAVDSVTGPPAAGELANRIDQWGQPEEQRGLRWMLAERLEAHGHIDRSGPLWQQVHDSTSNPAQRALLAYRLGRWAMNDFAADVALPYFTTAAEFFSDADGIQHRMRALSQAGFAHFDLRDLPAAEAAFTASVDLFRAHPAFDAVGASALRGLGQVRSIQGRFDESAALGEQALTAVRESAPDTVSEAKVLNFLGYTIARTNDVTRGEALLRGAIAMADQLEPDGINAAGFRNNLALIYYFRQDYDYARTLYGEALARFERRNPVSPVVARTRYNIALTLSQQRRHAEAAAMLETVLDLQQQLVPGTEDVARTLHSLAIQYEGADQMAKAIATEQQALDLYRQLLPNSYLAATSTHKLGQLYLRNNNLTQAEQLLIAALTLIRRVLPESAVHAEAVFDLGEVRTAQSRDQDALPLYREAVAVIEALQAKLGGGDAAVSAFRKHYSHFFRRLLEAELNQGDSHAAFAISERYRAQSFLALMGSKPAALTSRLPPALKSRWEAAQQAYENALKEAASETADQQQQAALVTARQRWRDAGDELRNVSNVGALLSPQIANPEQIADALTTGEALVSFVAQDNHVDAFVLKPDGSLIYRKLALERQTLSTSASRIRILMGLPDMGATGDNALNEYLRSLGTALFEPLSKELKGVSRLVVIPDAELWLLPMAALVTNDSYLVERFEIQLGWSATAYTRQGPSIQDGPMLAFADPAGGSQSEGGDDTGQSADVTRDPIRTSGALPGARREVTRIADLFDNASLFLDEGASETNFRTGAADAGILHVAAHAVTRVDPPMESYLQLSGDERHDGRLMAWEVLENLQLNAQLVTLSGCATALGAGAGGEGLMGLTRAFGVAGARRVMASLWPVSDQATADLMERFYEHRSNGLDDAAALRQAQLSFLKPSLIKRLRSGLSSRHQHPFYWAAFSLYGARPGQE